jgi:3-oxoacyl-[acyl-carrier-protein] synthase II
VPVACRIDRTFPNESRRGAELAAIAITEALSEAGDIDRSRTGVFLGTTMGESSAFEGARDLSELRLRDCSGDSFTRRMAARFDLGGRRRSFGTACAAGNYALVAGAGALLRGRVDAAVAGGVEPFSRLAAVGFSRMRAMAPDACRPFDVDRTGMQLGEGAAVVILERESDAIRRGPRILATVEGWGLSGDAYHPTAPRPDGSGMAAAMRACLEHAGVAPEHVGWICAHGSGTPLSDAAEARAIHDVFGRQAPPVTSLKGALGHSMGAAAAVEAVLATRALTEGILPPTANLSTIDPALALDVPVAARPSEARYVLNAGYGFGGVNSAVLLGAA